MAFVNLVYLALGMGIGMGVWSLFSQSKRQEPQADTTQQPDTTQQVSILKEPAASPASDNVSSLKEQLKQTQVAYQMASEMSQFKAGFLARTSHELRSPLSSMMGLHQLILNDLCENQAEEREFVAQAYASAQKLLKLLDEIVAVSKTEHGTTSMEIHPIQLAGVLEEVYSLTHLQAANRSLQLQISPPDPEIYIKADPRRLRQVLVNLVDTAIFWMQEGSIHIRTQTSPTSGYAHIWIDAQCPESAWSEPVDLLESAAKTQVHPSKAGDSLGEQTAGLSPGLNILINQILIEMMAGRLEVVAVPPEDASGESATANSTRWQCSIPLASTAPA